MWRDFADYILDETQNKNVKIIEVGVGKFDEIANILSSKENITLIKTDINSFDVETVISDTDWRLLRLAFHCGKKDNFMQCKALFDLASCEEPAFADVEKLSELASKNPACLKTVPGFYNIQISE